jgi:enolase-phosphatase E1
MSEEPSAIVLDVEGTTTPIAFVHQRLFGYAAAHLPAFLAAHEDDAGVAEQIDELRAQWQDDAEGGTDLPAWSDASTGARTASAARYCAWLSAHDRKTTALKALQGYVWRSGYESGELRGEVYEDVPPALAAWRARGRSVAIYSSGSVLAQRLLFRHAAPGDLTSLISGFFDTRVGAKDEPASYRRLAARLGFPAERLAFVSDSRRELEAARAARLTTVACVRSGMDEGEMRGYPVVHRLGEVDDVVAAATTSAASEPSFAGSGARASRSPSRRAGSATTPNEERTS